MGYLRAKKIRRAIGLSLPSGCIYLPYYYITGVWGETPFCDVLIKKLGCFRPHFCAKIPYFFWLSPVHSLGDELIFEVNFRVILENATDFLAKELDLG